MCINNCLSGDSKINIKIDNNETIINTTIKTLEFILNRGKNRVRIESYNEETNTIEFDEVVACEMTSLLEDVISIIDNSTEDEIICTKDHLILTKNKNWIEAEKLLLDDDINIINHTIKLKEYYEDEENDNE